MTEWADVQDMGPTIKCWSWQPRAPRPQPLAACTPPLTTLVLILPAGTMKDPVAPLKGTDTGPRGATLHPRHRALALRWQREGRETPVRLRNQGNHPTPTTVLSSTPRNKGEETSP